MAKKTFSLTREEREYLADKVFWDSKYAEVDCWTAEFIGGKKAIKNARSVYDWYNNLYNKLTKEEANEKEKSA